ncbi:MAG TPA: hypothetical protein VJ647_03115, partial [Chitinophagaceae bacterium]|nr:hypothetical protein [Chitinophagaceae bacterium]
GITGFIVESMPQAVEALKNIDSLSRIRVRELFEERFTAERMAYDYIQLYDKLITSKEHTYANSFSGRY